jgi:hypothetical protein
MTNTETAGSAQKQARGIMTAYRKTTTIGQPVLDALNQRAQDILAAIDLLTAAVECADLKANSQDAAADLGEEFTAASTALTQAFAGLKGYVLLLRYHAKSQVGLSMIV